MSFQPIDWRSEQLRTFIQNGPNIEIRPLMVLVGDTTGTHHVTANKALTVAIELLGLTRVHEFIRRDRNVASAWMVLIEDFGWGDDPSSVHRNLQLTLLVNAIKHVVRKENPGNRLKAEELTTGLMQVLELGADVEYKMIDHLFLRGNYDVPWTIWI